MDIPIALDYPIFNTKDNIYKFNKLSSNYLVPFLMEAEKNYGRVYAKFNQKKTLTGRLSSSSPNLQNIPAKSEFGRKFRRAFISSFKEGVIFSCDYSQIELRVVAHFSGDKTLIDAFMRDSDVHTHTASLLFGVSEENVVPYQRKVAKRVNFGVIYGMSPYGLAKELSVSYEEALIFINNYFERYPAIKDYVAETVRQAQEKGFVRTILGRMRFFEDSSSRKQDFSEFYQRQAVNTPIQGSAADLIKMAMVDVWREFKKHNVSSRIVIQIHDELVFDVKKEDLPLIREIAREKMEHVLKLRVPLKVNMKVGSNWADMEEV